MAKTNSRWRLWLKQLRNKYRLVIMHEKTFEIQASVKLSMLNVIIILSTLFVVLAFLVYAAIAFTPLKNYVVGYSEVSTTRQILENRNTTDSLLRALDASEAYFANLRQRLNGEIDTIPPVDSLKNKNYSEIDLNQVSAMDKQLREQVEQEFQFSVSSPDPKLTESENLRSLYFFPPLKGTITADFDTKAGHFGVDVVAKEETPVKACLDGTVIDAYWNVESGNVIAVQHDHGLISFYRHNSVLLKKTGNFVKAGDVIAIIGNTGELSTGPHLHFELWHNRTPVNPRDFINFN